MFISAPVYTMQNNTHFVNIYSETEEGVFKRTQDEPLRLLRDDFIGISLPQGELVTNQFDRHKRDWSTATISYHYGRPQSFYTFLREMLARNKIFVFTMPAMSGRLCKFEIHELLLSRSISQRKISMLKEKYAESIGLWSKEEYAARKERQRRMLHKRKLMLAKEAKKNAAIAALAAPLSLEERPVYATTEKVRTYQTQHNVHQMGFVLEPSDTDVDLIEKTRALSRKGRNLESPPISSASPTSSVQSKHFLNRFIFSRG